MAPWHPAMAPHPLNHSTLQWHPAMTPRPLNHSTLQRLPAMAPSNGTTSTAPCNGILVPRPMRKSGSSPSPLIGSKNPYSYRYLGKNWFLLSGVYAGIIYVLSIITIYYNIISFRLHDENCLFSMPSLPHPRLPYASWPHVWRTASVQAKFPGHLNSRNHRIEHSSRWTWVDITNPWNQNLQED